MWYQNVKEIFLFPQISGEKIVVVFFVFVFIQDRREESVKCNQDNNK